jgi:hypothetical protein
MRTLVSSLLFISTSAALAVPAVANPPATEAATEADFALVDHTDDDSKLNIEVATIFPTDPDAEGVLIRPNIHGQFIAPNGFGAYGAFAMSKLSSGGDWATGSLELGGLFHRALTPNVDLGIRAGVILPTAKGGGSALMHLLSTLVVRPSDLATVSPDTTWLRLCIAPTYRNGPLFLRADVGVDLAVANGEEVDPMGHVNVGAGVGNSKFSATAEMQTVFATLLDKGDFGAFHTAGLSGRYHGKMVSPFVLVSTPIDDLFRGDVFTVTGGLSLSL